ncbi:MAG: fibronectin type III domain-containing protein [Patescibacteria group bacterium]|nr:fibronectin type III domain-containing protein [Patescibacteria group bacterium]
MSLDQRVLEVLNERTSSHQVNNRSKLPLVVIALLSVSLISSLALSKINPQVLLFAGASPDPRDVRVTDITASTFTVSWRTEEKTTGYLKYGLNPDNLTFTGEENNQNLQTNQHEIRLNSLQPNTQYYYHIVSNGKEYLGWEGNLFYPIKTVGKS